MAAYEENEEQLRSNEERLRSNEEQLRAELEGTLAQVCLRISPHTRTHTHAHALPSVCVCVCVRARLSLSVSLKNGVLFDATFRFLTPYFFLSLFSLSLSVCAPAGIVDVLHVPHLTTVCVRATIVRAFTCEHLRKRSPLTPFLLLDYPHA